MLRCKLVYLNARNIYSYMVSKIVQGNLKQNNFFDNIFENIFNQVMFYYVLNQIIAFKTHGVIG